VGSIHRVRSLQSLIFSVFDEKACHGELRDPLHERLSVMSLLTYRSASSDPGSEPPKSVICALRSMRYGECHTLCLSNGLYSLGSVSLCFFVFISSDMSRGLRVQICATWCSEDSIQCKATYIC
jgi:hypothetical protein